MFGSSPLCSDQAKYQFLSAGICKINAMALAAYLDSIRDMRIMKVTYEINMVAKHGLTSNDDIDDTASQVSSMCIEEEII